jgi:CubicO group peptidase (beta-lactamase class C family)
MARLEKVKQIAGPVSGVAATPSRLALRYVVAIALLGACVAIAVPANAEQTTVRSDFPVAVGTDEIQPAWPEDVGVDSSKLVALSEWIRKEKLDVRSFLVVKDDKLIFERYGDNLNRDYNYEMYSVTKMVTSLLAGQLIADGKVHLDDPIAPILAKWRPDLAGPLQDKQNIELRHVLMMSTGLKYTFTPPNDPIYYTAPDRLKLAVETQPLLQPGVIFQYMDINPILAAATLSAAAGEPLEKYAEEQLFTPMGLRNAVWTRADKMGLVSTGWGLRLRAIDMAKIGLLVLHDGQFNGQQIVPASWIRQMTSPGVVPFFGYFWWIKNVLEGGSEGGSQPEYDAMGFKGQFILVLPEHHAVVTMTSMLPIEGGLRDSTNLQLFRYMVVRYVLPALEAGSHGPASEQSRQALLHELQVSAQTMGTPGVSADPTDTPQK